MLDGTPPSLQKPLDRLLGGLAADTSVEAVHIGGSVARGEADDFSDLDLWIEGPNWAPESISGLLLTAMRMEMAGHPFLHGVLDDGTIVDIIYGPKVAWDGFVRLELPEPIPMDPMPLPPYGFREEFWVSSLKHRKNILRFHHKLVIIGMGHDRMNLIKAWVLHDTGDELPSHAFTIYGLKGIMDRHVTEERQALLGLPLRNRAEIIAAVHAYRDEMSRLFPEPTGLELAVRSLALA